MVIIKRTKTYVMTLYLNPCFQVFFNAMTQVVTSSYRFINTSPPYLFWMIHPAYIYGGNENQL